MKSKLILLVCLLLMTSQIAKSQESAETIIKEAQVTAKKEGKHIFVLFHASWCGWCKKMDNNMMSDKTKALFEGEYIIKHLTVQESKKNKNLENPGAQELLVKYKGENSGIPFWLIFDADGNLITDSLDNKGNNIGCPATPDEVKQFTAKLKSSSSLTDTDLKVIYNQFVDRP